MTNSEKNCTATIHTLFEEQVTQTPDAIALICEETQLTYRELHQKSNQLAHYLQHVGVRRESLVGVCLDRSANLIIGLLGILKAGAAYVPLDPTYPQARLLNIIEDANISLLLTQTSLKNLLPIDSDRCVTIEQVWGTNHNSFYPPTCCNQPDDLAYVIYTSGSTGTPKGVAIEHRNTVAFLNWVKDFFTPSQLAGVLGSTSICFDLSIFEIFGTLCCGGTIILVRDALALAQLSAKNLVTLINTVPSAATALLESGSIPSSVRCINLAGEPLQNKLAQQLYHLDHIEFVYNLYGPSEDTTYSTVALIQKGTTSAPTIGKPLPNSQTEILLLNSDLEPVSAGETGEIFISSPKLARGYLHNPDLTNDRFIIHPTRAIRLYKTGDLASLLPDGNLKYLGRIDHQVKIRGFRVELGEIESVLTAHSGIRDAVVVAKDTASDNKRLVSYLVPNFSNHDSATVSLIDSSDAQQVQEWQTVWNATYGQSSAAHSDPTFNSTGWTDSFTGQTMPDEEVREWVNGTVDRIRSLRPQRVLEIGCGMGLLLFRIAPYCTQYYGVDLSTEAINNLQQQLDRHHKNWSHVTVQQKAAHEISDFEPSSFDTVVINSVIQYFPDVTYLVRVLEAIVKLVKPGGKVFVGDVRSLPLLEAFHTGVQLNQAADSLSSEQFAQRVNARIAQDRELVLHPDFFNAIKQHIPRISYVQTELKRGHTPNELIRFRSDVILHIEASVSPIPESLRLDWQQQELSMPQLRRVLQQTEPKSLHISNITDARLATELQAIALLASPNKPATVGDLRDALQQIDTAVHPEEFWSLADDFSYDVYLTWTASKASGLYDAVLRRRSAQTSTENVEALPEPQLELKPWGAYANNPLQINQKSSLLSQLRSLLKERLPDYMMPSAFVILEHLPLTLNGKVDRNALPEPKKERPVLAQSYVAPSTALEEQLAEIWSHVLEIEHVGVYDNFFELGGHSLLAAQLLVQIEEATQIKLPIFYLLQEPTIAGLIAAMQTIEAADTASKISESIADLDADTVLDPAIYAKQPYIASTAEPEHIFLTGATGFLGAFLLNELLQKTQATIYCLIRADNLKGAWRKLETNLKRYSLWHSKLKPRIIPLLGDLSKPLLGLGEDTFQTVSNKLDLIYHCGAFVNLVYPYSTLRSANVFGAQEILRLASQSKVTPVHYISTIDVLKPLASYKKTVVCENEHHDWGHRLGMGYTQTKWVAEKLIMAAQSRGIPTCIYRPGMITGDSKTGASQTDDLICRLIKGIIQLESAPDLDEWVNMTPVDYASQAIVYLSRQQTSLGRAFHIINPEALPWNQLIDTIDELGYPVDLVSHDEWQATLLELNGTEGNALSPMRSLFTEKFEAQLTYLETFLMTAKMFDCQNVLNELAKTAIACPQVDADLLKTYFAYFINQGFLTPPATKRRRQNFQEQATLFSYKLPILRDN